MWSLPLSSVNVELKPIVVKTKAPANSDAFIKVEYKMADANNYLRTHFTTKLVRVPTGNPEKGAAKAIRAVVSDFINKASIVKVSMLNFSGADLTRTPDIDLTTQPKINKDIKVPGKNNAKKPKDNDGL